MKKSVGCAVKSHKNLAVIGCASQVVATAAFHLQHDFASWSVAIARDPAKFLTAAVSLPPLCTMASVRIKTNHNSWTLQLQIKLTIEFRPGFFDSKIHQLSPV